jgi:phage portal protein BeeE
MDGVIERDKDMKPWKEEQYTAWRTKWQERVAGRRNAGSAPVLMPGMKWIERTYSAKDSELTVARKLTREEVARAYHVPLPMVGILDHATFSNIKEQHKQLYADTLGPWLVMLEEELERQLLPESDDAENVYLEFNIAEKLKGSFEEQADAIMKLTGRPVMTANEARARLNLPAMDDPSADELALQLNTTTPSTPANRDEPDESAIAAVVSRHQARQMARLEKLDDEDRPAAFNLTRYNRELAADLERVGVEPDRAKSIAHGVNAATLGKLTDAAQEAMVLNMRRSARALSS